MNRAGPSCGASERDHVDVLPRLVQRVVTGLEQRLVAAAAPCCGRQKSAEFDLVPDHDVVDVARARERSDDEGAEVVRASAGGRRRRRGRPEDREHDAVAEPRRLLGAVDVGHAASCRASSARAATGASRGPPEPEIARASATIALGVAGPLQAVVVDPDHEARRRPRPAGASAATRQQRKRHRARHDAASPTPASGRRIATHWAAPTSDATPESADRREEQAEQGNHVRSPGGESGCPDLNWGPLRPERSALPGCATPRAGESYRFAGRPRAPRRVDAFASVRASTIVQAS